MTIRYKLSEAADQLRVSPAQVEKLLAAGLLVAHTDTDEPRSHRFISQKALDAYIESREAGASRGRRHSA